MNEITELKQRISVLQVTLRGLAVGTPTWISVKSQLDNAVIKLKSLEQRQDIPSTTFTPSTEPMISGPTRSTNEIDLIRKTLIALEGALRNSKPGTLGYNTVLNQINEYKRRLKILEAALEPLPDLPHSNGKYDDIQELKNTIFILEHALKSSEPGSIGYTTVLNQLNKYKEILSSLEIPVSNDYNGIPYAGNSSVSIDPVTIGMISLFALGGLYIAYKLL